MQIRHTTQYRALNSLHGGRSAVRAPARVGQSVAVPERASDSGLSLGRMKVQQRMWRSVRISSARSTEVGAVPSRSHQKSTALSAAHKVQLASAFETTLPVAEMILHRELP